MVDSPNVNPSGKSHGADQNGDAGKSAPKSWHPKPLKWLGMTFDSDQTKKLWSIISQNISSAIDHDKAQAIKAIKKMNPEQDQDDDS